MLKLKERKHRVPHGNAQLSLTLNKANAREIAKGMPQYIIKLEDSMYFGSDDYTIALGKYNYGVTNGDFEAYTVTNQLQCKHQSMYREAIFIKYPFIDLKESVFEKTLAKATLDETETGLIRQYISLMYTNHMYSHNIDSQRKLYEESLAKLKQFREYPGVIVALEKFTRYLYK